MATYREVPRPPVFRGTEEERWRQMHTYLYKLSEHLEHVLNNMTKEGATSDEHPVQKA